MDDIDFLVFSALFKDAYAKCFGHALKNQLTETESKIFCNKILEQTGLSIGWKSMKNYSFFIVDAVAGKKENPSVATLDTLARYALSAPYTTEIQRKDNESHYPYWFLYREKYVLSAKKIKPGKSTARLALLAIGIVIIIGIGTWLYGRFNSRNLSFTDQFNDTDNAAMLDNGWFVKSKDSTYWNKRSATAGQLTLYTLSGDNWPDPSSKPNIKNLLLRKIPGDCFTAEVHLKNFIPQQEWQQAGILLLEDTSFTGKSIRLSLAYNDVFGGIKKPREILIQAITSLGNNFGKPEEIAHKPIFYVDSLRFHPQVIDNLQNTALRIEKHGKKYRFLYAGGTRENGAFTEVVSQEFDMKPHYIGLFAIKGFTGSAIIPVSFKFFRITADDCD